MTMATAVSSANAFDTTSGSQTTFHSGGAIKALLIHDSNVTGLGANIPANALLLRNNDSETKIDASLSQFKLGAKTEFDSGRTVDTLFVMDFNANNDGTMSPRLREALVNLDLGTGRLIAGQTWSTLMDMKNIPPSIAEATLSGVAFKRQPLIRWSQNVDSFQYDIALESGKNSAFRNVPDIISPDKAGAIPDLVGAVEWNGSTGWIRTSAVLSSTRFEHNDETNSKLGYGVQISGGWNISEGHRLTLLTYTGEGTEQYLLGLSDSGATWKPEDQKLELTKTQSVMGSYQHQWSENWKSAFAYGKVQTFGTAWKTHYGLDSFVSTEYGMANLLWEIEKDLTMGLEYNYSKYNRSLIGDRDNHRFMLGINWHF